MGPPENREKARLPVGITGVTALRWAIAAPPGLEEQACMWGSFIPAGLQLDYPFSRAPAWLTPLTATLLHAGIFHLAFNLLILAFCGRSVEPVLGSPSVAILYFAGAYAAAGAHWATSPHAIAPVIGASGAISAVLGAYAMFFGRQRLKIANPTLGLVVNALWLAAAWTAFQLLIGLTVPQGEVVPGIAGHIGGFIAGLLIARPLLLLRWRGA